MTLPKTELRASYRTSTERSRRRFDPKLKLYRAATKRDTLYKKDSDVWKGVADVSRQKYWPEFVVMAGA